MLLRINPMVVQDLKRIKEYIEVDNPEAANKMIDGLYERFEKLTLFPGIGSELSKRVSFPTDFRYLVYGAYITLYRIEDDCISVYRVLNCKQDITSSIFFDKDKDSIL